MAEGRLNMRKILLILLLFCSSLAYGATGNPTTVWKDGNTVTATELNNNENAVWSILNGGLDNDNANNSAGYFFYEKKATLPIAGTPGRVVFNTGDSTLNLDNGSSWQSTVTPLGTLATGIIPYYNSGWKILTPGTQYYSLISNGTSSLPSYQLVGLTTGVSGILPMANGGTGSNLGTANQGDILYDNGSVFVRLTPGTAGQVLTTSGASANPSWTTKAPDYTAGNALIISADTSRTISGGGTWAKTKEFILARDGTLRIKFTLTAGGGANIYGKIYRNGSPVGQQRLTQFGNTTEWSEDIGGWSVGDYCQLYSYTEGSGSVSNFRIYSTYPSFEYITTDTDL